MKTASLLPPHLVGLLLAILLALPLCGCRGTTLDERMPVSANTISGMLNDAQTELQAVQRRHATLDLDRALGEHLARLAQDIQADVLDARAALQEARRDVDADKLEQAGEWTLLVFRRIQDLRDEGILAEYATNPEG